MASRLIPERVEHVSVPTSVTVSHHVEQERHQQFRLERAAAREVTRVAKEALVLDCLEEAGFSRVEFATLSEAGTEFGRVSVLYRP